MKKLSKRSKQFIELFLKMDDMKYVSLSKHDVRILYDIYKKSIKEYLVLDDEIRVLTNLINDVKEDLINTKRINNHFKDKYNNELINVDIDHIDYLINKLEKGE